jgi:hypothetical protein
MKQILALSLVLLSALAPCQDAELRPIRIRVRHADPWAVVAMLQGQPVMSPEISTVIGILGFPTPPSPGFGTLLPKGRLFINPGDNSIWFVPEK